MCRTRFVQLTHGGDSLTSQGAGAITLSHRIVNEVNMRTKIITGVVAAAAALYWARSIGGQVQSVPGPGSGIVIVQGEVDVRRFPQIAVGQQGDWKVSLANVADVRVANTPAVAAAPLPFLRVGGRYMVTWPVGEQETFEVAQLGGGAWVRAAVDGRFRWLNLTVAKSIDEVR